MFEVRGAVNTRDEHLRLPERGRERSCCNSSNQTTAERWVRAAEAEDILDSEMAFREKQLALEKAYGIKLKNALPIKKVLILRKAERKFKKQLLDRMKKGQARRGVSNGPSEHPVD